MDIFNFFYRFYLNAIRFVHECKKGIEYEIRIEIYDLCKIKIKIEIYATWRNWIIFLGKQTYHFIKNKIMNTTSTKNKKNHEYNLV